MDAQSLKVAQGNFERANSTRFTQKGKQTMKSINGNRQARDHKLSEQFVEFIDLTDENLEEVTIQGGFGGFCGFRRFRSRFCEFVGTLPVGSGGIRFTVGT